MGKIESSIGSVNYGGNQMKNLEVSDESEEYETYDGNDNPFASYENHYMKHREGAKQQHFKPEKTYVEEDAPAPPFPQKRQQGKIVPPVRHNFVANDEETLRVEREINKIKQQKAQAASGKLNDFSRKRLDILIGMSKLTRNVNIEGTEYELQSLSAKELREVYVNAIKFNETVEFPYELRRQILSKSLTSIAGINIYEFVNSYDQNDILSMLDELGEGLAARLFEEYQLLSNEVANKYAIKNEADMKEVIEDLKK